MQMKTLKHTIYDLDWNSSTMEAQLHVEKIEKSTSSYSVGFKLFNCRKQNVTLIGIKRMFKVKI